MEDNTLVQSSFSATINAPIEKVDRHGSDSLGGFDGAISITRRVSKEMV